MKVTADFVLRQIADEYLLIPVGQAALQISGMISLTESGYLLYQHLQSGCSREDLIELLLGSYDVTPQQASADVDAFLEKLRKLQILEESM